MVLFNILIGCLPGRVYPLGVARPFAVEERI